MDIKPVKLARLFRRPAAGSGEFESIGRDRYESGNALTLYFKGGDAYKAMWRAIELAQETIHLETYIFSSDRTGEEFAARLMEKARAGVRVRLIIDGMGSLDIDPEMLTRLRNSGAQILDYHPVAPWRARWDWQRRDHRKILVVDGRVGFTGGVNISRENAPVELGGLDWRDTHVRVEGPAAFALDRLFRIVWFKETGRWFESSNHPEAAHGPSRVWVAANDEFFLRYSIRSVYLKALRAARREVLITNAYFIPDRGIRRALAAAVRRGVSVKILVPGRSDVASVWHAGRYRYDFLLRHGVRLYEWMGPILHAKTVVIDRTWSAVGSYNLDHRSLLHNLEANLHVLDSGVAEQLAGQFTADLAHSREIHLLRWRRRRLIDRAFERLFYFFRYFF